MSESLKIGLSLGCVVVSFFVIELANRGRFLHKISVWFGEKAVQLDRKSKELEQRANELERRKNKD